MSYYESNCRIFIYLTILPFPRRAFAAVRSRVLQSLGCLIVRHQPTNSFGGAASLISSRYRPIRMCLTEPDSVRSSALARASSQRYKDGVVDTIRVATFLSSVGYEGISSLPVIGGFGR